MVRWASIVCVSLGASSVGALTAWTLLKRTEFLKIGFLLGSELNISLVVILAFLIVAVFFSLFERFEHWITAFIFGAATPGLIFALANIFSLK